MELLAAANEVAQRKGVDEWHGLMVVLLKILNERPSPLPVHGPLVAANNYWTGLGDEQALSAAKHECWEFLRTFARGEDVANPEGRYARALLCVLEPDGDDEDASMAADWFVDMLYAPNDSSVGE